MWARHARTGKAAPLEPRSDGRFVLEPGGETYRSAGPEDARAGRRHYASHYATCPDAKDWRR